MEVNNKTAPVTGQQDQNTISPVSYTHLFWPRRIVPFGYNMIDPFGQNRIDHLVYLLS